MNRRIALLVAVVVVVGGVGVAAAGPIGTVVAQDGAESEDGSAESNETADMSPGERLSGVVGVQNAEVTGEVESRAFEVGLDRAETSEERADLVAQRLDRSEQRLDAIEQRQRELQERRDAGELSQGAYAARMAETAARAETVRRDANRTAAVAGEIPETVRADRGLGDERLGTLRDRASELSGPEVAAIARGVTGTDVGGPIASERRGPPAELPANESDRRGGGSAGNVGERPTNQSAGERPTNQSAGEQPTNQSAGGNQTVSGGQDDGPSGSTADGDAADGTDRETGNATAADRYDTTGAPTAIGSPAPR